MDHAFHNSVKNIFMTLEPLYYTMNGYIVSLGDKNNVKYNWQDNQTKIIHSLYMYGSYYFIYLFFFTLNCLYFAAPRLAIFGCFSTR